MHVHSRQHENYKKNKFKNKKIYISTTRLNVHEIVIINFNSAKNGLSKLKLELKNHKLQTFFNKRKI